MKTSDVRRIRTGVWDEEHRYIRCLSCDPIDYTLTTQEHIEDSAPPTCPRCMGDMWIDDSGVLVLWGHPGGGMGYV